MEALLLPVSTSYTPKKDLLIEVSKGEAPKRVKQSSLVQASTPEEALEILKNEPDYEALLSTLRFLHKSTSKFNIHSPGPLASQLIQVLVTEIVPNYWAVLRDSDGRHTLVQKNGKSKNKGHSELLLSCLRSVPGFGAMALKIKQDIKITRSTNNKVGEKGGHQNLSSLLQVLEKLLEGETAVQILWETVVCASGVQATRKGLWKEALAIFGGKLSGLVAESEDLLKASKAETSQACWIADGSLYAGWLSENICSWVQALRTDDEQGWKACGELLSKSLRLGHTVTIVKRILHSLLLIRDAQHQRILKLLDQLPTYEQRNFFQSVIEVLGKDFLSTEITTEANSQWWKSDKDIVGAAAALIHTLIANQESRRSHFVSWLTSSSGAGVGDGIALRRAVVTAMAQDKNEIEMVLEKSLKQFGDQLYIKHVPSMQQEVHAQVLLLSAGQVHRTSPLRFKMIIRSGGHLNVVSNRLGASSSRARFLGMVIAEALSSLADQGDKKMDFKLDEMNTPEALWYKSLVNVDDYIGSMVLLQSSQTVDHTRSQAPEEAKPKPKPIPKRPVAQTSKIIAIEEVSDDDDEEATDSDEDGLTPYAKPDSDAEDSDEDPTLITRNKPTAPVYIRDLILYLRDGGNYDKQKLGLQTAAALIRRKAKFGSEVSEHAEELAALLVGIQDKYEIEDFDDLRLQGMIALIIAQPQKMGQWFAKTFFDGDYSLSQRASILTTLGLSARELGGYGPESNASTASADEVFPSKHLPASTHKRFTALPPTTSSAALKPIASLTQQLQNAYLAPLATSIADKSAGPDIFKLTTLSSRVKTRPKPATKIITNTLATMIASSFVFPLTGRFFVHLKAYGAASTANVVFQPHLLAHFLKTLAVLLHASGPATLALPQMTAEFWDLLLALRAQAAGDIAILEALLFALLTILEINEEKRILVEENGGRLLETQGWVEGVFGRLEGSGEEEARVKMCAAGVLVRIREVVEKYQALLMGDLVRFDG